MHLPEKLLIMQHISTETTQHTALYNQKLKNTQRNSDEKKSN